MSLLLHDSCCINHAHTPAPSCVLDPLSCSKPRYCAPTAHKAAANSFPVMDLFRASFCYVRSRLFDRLSSWGNDKMDNVLMLLWLRIFFFFFVSGIIHREYEHCSTLLNSGIREHNGRSCVLAKYAKVAFGFAIRKLWDCVRLRRSWKIFFTNENFWKWDAFWNVPQFSELLTFSLRSKNGQTRVERFPY